MSEADTYLAVFVGDASGTRRAVWMALPEEERKAKQQEGMQALHAWMAKHADSVVQPGGPLGKTKRVDGEGVHDVKNLMGGFIVVRAASPEEAAALFEDHPQFTVFPGGSVEIMPILAVPGN